jgi:hypothetical protein
MKLRSALMMLPAAAFVSLAFMPGDSCSLYAPSKKDMQLEYVHFSAKDKQEGSTKMKVLDVKDEGAVTSIQMQSEVFDKKSKPVGTSTYELKCEGGTFYVDMQSMVSSEQKAAFKDMKLDVQGDKLDIPANPVAGQALKDGMLHMNGSQEGSPLKFNLTMRIHNRKVEAIEDITVPAGTYRAVKITYDMDTKFMIPVKSKAAEWYVKDIGLVRSETFDKNGKLQGYMVLSTIK